MESTVRLCAHHGMLEKNKIPIMVSSMSSKRLHGVVELNLRAPPAARGLALVDPSQPIMHGSEGDLVLAVGTNAALIPRLVRSLAASTAGIVLSQAQATASVRRAARTTGTPLYLIPDGVGWTEVYDVLAAAVRPATVSGRTRPGRDLTALAETIAHLTGGLVIIEDAQDRLIAYSRSTDDVDELRRLSILGRSGPPEYLALLREWGVYQKLSGPDTVVEIAADAGSGIRARLAVGVFAGRRRLGTIWVQQGSMDFPPHARQALLGAARLTAEQLVGATDALNGEPAEDAVRDLLGGPESTALQNRADAADPCQVIAVAPREWVADPVERIAALTALSSTVTLHAVGYRSDAMTAIIDEVCYVLLPGLTPAPTDGITGRAIRTMTTAARQRLDIAVSAGIGPVVPRLSDAYRSRVLADRALGYRSGEGSSDVRFFSEIRAHLVTNIAVEAVDAAGVEYSDVALTQLRSGSPDLALTLLRYLDVGSDVGQVAETLDLHPTTVRYRLRRAVEISGLDLSDPERRLAAHLQLRASVHSANGGSTT
jgi:PucR C-terminal helix-turn-helix domain/GGDEF-like domain